MVSHHSRGENSPPPAEDPGSRRNKRNRRPTERQNFSNNELHQKEIRALEKQIANMKKVYNQQARAPLLDEDTDELPPEEEEENDEHIHFSSSMRPLSAYTGQHLQDEDNDEEALHPINLRRGPLRPRNIINDSDHEDSPGAENEEGNPPMPPTEHDSASGPQYLAKKRGHISSSAVPIQETVSSKRQCLEVSSNNTVKTKKKAPSLDDFDEEVRAVVKQASHEFEVLCVTRDGFPNMNTRVIWAHCCWDNAKQFLQVEDNSDLPSKASLLIRGRTSRIRGHLVDTIVRGLVESSYGFRNGSSMRNIQKNQDLVANLTREGSFMYKDFENRKGFLKHLIFGKIIKNAFFKNEHARGVEFKEYFSPISVSMLALLSTMIYACITEWESGKQVLGHFKEDKYIKKYEGFCSDIGKWKDLFPEVTANMLKKMFEQPYLDACPSNAGTTSIFSEESIDRLREEMEGHTGNTDSEDD